MFSPIACKKVISGTLNNVGINQFHNHISGNAKIMLSIIAIKIIPKSINNLFIIFCFLLIVAPAGIEPARIYSTGV